MDKLGVALIGLGGAVATTVVAGVHLMLRDLAPRRGMLTEPCDLGPGLTGGVDLPALEALVFGGWDVDLADAHTAALRHRVLHPSQLAPVADALRALHPWPAITESSPGSHRAHVAQIQADLAAFRAHHSLARLVLINVASTAPWQAPEDPHEDLAAFEAALDENDPRITPLMRYLYAAQAMGVPHANFTPSLGHVPALAAHAAAHAVPFAGADGKTGQTLVKTILGAMFRIRRLFVDGWYSVNFLGNNDGRVLESPGNNRTKIVSKSAVLDSVVGHPVPNHQVHIHYYPPRGDAKEAWDNIDFTGFAGVPMQMKINFLCQDSILAAPLVIDLARLLDLAARRGEVGAIESLGLFFKSPYHRPGHEPVHDLTRQEAALLAWLAGP